MVKTSNAIQKIVLINRKCSIGVLLLFGVGFAVRRRLIILRP